MRWVREFNITVETIEHFFPQLKSKVDNIFYDAKSLILAFNSEYCYCSLCHCGELTCVCVAVIIPLSVFIAFAMTLGFLMYMIQQHQ